MSPSFPTTKASKIAIDELYRQLHELQTTNAAALGLVDVFHTYVGPSYHSNESNVRLMMVGKATAEWKVKGTSPEVNQSDKFIEKEIIPGKYHSAFWFFMKSLALALHNHPDLENDKEIYRSVAWSNVMRIGEGGYNPGRTVAALQRKACLELLKSEVDLYAPTHLVFVTGSTYWRDLEQLFPVNWTEHATDYWRAKYGETQIFWTRHPQGWEKTRRDEVIDLIAHA